MTGHMGIGAPAPAPVKKVNAFVGTGVKTTSATSYTFTAQSIGAASPFRRLVVGIAATAASGNPDLTASMTCDGVSMIDMGQTHSGGGFAAHVGFFTILKPTGTTADFVLSFAAAPECCAIAVWTEEGYETTNLYDDSQDFGTQNQSWNIDEIADGLEYGIVVGRNSTVRTFTWTGLTEDFDTTIKASAASFSGARKALTATTAATTPSNSASGTQSKGCGRVQAVF